MKWSTLCKVIFATPARQESVKAVHPANHNMLFKDVPLTRGLEVLTTKMSIERNEEKNTGCNMIRGEHHELGKAHMLEA